MASGERWKSYKTKGNVEEGRRRREEEGVQLRKSKHEEVSSTLKICVVNVHEMRDKIFMTLCTIHKKT